MDELDRLFQCIVRAVHDARPEGLTRSIEVGELLDLVPYRNVRADIGVETNDDFTHTVTRLLAGERGYLFVDDLMQDDLQAELTSPNPNLTAYRAYLNARVTLSQEHVRRSLESMGQPAASVATASAPSSSAGAATAPDAVDDRPAPSPPAASPSKAALEPADRGLTARPPSASPVAARTDSPVRREGPTGPRAPRSVSSPRPLDLDSVAPQRAARPGCRYCGQALPEGRDVHFCPACGQNLLVRRCAACSAELEAGWKFCVACGRAATP